MLSTVLNSSRSKNCLPQCVPNNVASDKRAITRVSDGLQPRLETHDSGEFLDRICNGPKSERRTLISSSGYPNLSLMNSTSSFALFSSELKVRTWPDSPSRKVRRASSDARVGCAAIIQEGHGVGTEPICIRASRQVSVRVLQDPTVARTYKPNFARIYIRLRREPLPHERARGSVVDRIHESLNVIVH